MLILSPGGLQIRPNSHPPERPNDRNIKIVIRNKAHYKCLYSVRAVCQIDFLVAYGEKSFKSIQIFQIIFYLICDLANSDCCFCPLGRTDLYDL